MESQPQDRPRPVILAVDDDAGIAARLDRELRSRYGADYSVVTERFPQKARADLARWRSEDREVALILADQWMPVLDGASLLGEARLVHPLAKRVMLVTWGDPSASEAILRGCAVGQIEFFIHKPWGASPDESFHHHVGAFLYDWAKANRSAFQPVRVVGRQWSRRSHELRDLLRRNGVRYGFVEAESPEAETLRQELGLDLSVPPIVVFFGGRVLVRPTNRQLSEALGARTRPNRDVHDLAIIGAGPAGLAAAVYASSEGLDTVAIEREAIGGQAAHSTMIRNYPGFPVGISGEELTSRAYQQAWQFGTTFIFANPVTGLRSEDGLQVLGLADGSELRARAVVVAMGISYRRLDIEGVDRLIGAGVFYGAVSPEARALSGEHVFIAGAGNSGGQAAAHLAKYASRVTILTREASLPRTMSAYLIAEIGALPNVEVLLHTRVVDGAGEGRLRELTLEDAVTGRRSVVPAAGLFVMIGATPHTGWLPLSLARDQDGYILTGRDLVSGEADRTWPLERLPLTLETSVPGVFAIGDVRLGSTKRVASAAGEGAMVVSFVQQYLRQSRQALRSVA